MGQKHTTESGGGAARLRGLITLLLSLAGLGLAGYLTVLHLGLMIGEVGGSALCGSGAGLGCHAVTASRYAVLLGLPVSIWGLFFYLTTALLGLGGILFRGASGRPFLRWALLLTGLALLFDLYLGSMMVLRIGVLCPLCITTYAINIGLFVTLFGFRRARPVPSASLKSVFPRRLPPGADDAVYYGNVGRGLLAGINLLLIVAVAAGYLALSQGNSAQGENQLAGILQQLERTRPVFVEDAGHPGLGSDTAPMTIVEFSDFRCPFCRRAADLIKIVAANNRDEARFVFRHYPLDVSCNPNIQRDIHPGACLLAEGAVCAHEQDRFWAFHDEAFASEGRVNRAVLDRLAIRAGLDAPQFRSCLDANRGRDAVRRDIQEAAALGVRSTPTIFLNGRGYAGVPSNPWVFERLIRQPMDPPVATGSPSP